MLAAHHRPRVAFRRQVRTRESASRRKGKPWYRSPVATSHPLHASRSAQQPKLPLELDPAGRHLPPHPQRAFSYKRGGSCVRRAACLASPDSTRRRRAKKQGGLESKSVGRAAAGGAHGIPIFLLLAWLAGWFALSARGRPLPPPWAVLPCRGALVRGQRGSYRPASFRTGG
ncbi:hypothetical protein PVAP13_1KG495020 [Panicum virgatum]|uniref:Uncharacterized protein n=1 Tax=Panicum virgatum TaxID=38727 RepID=A0A8T0XSU2_PANVG|nr:hypothetical protein PVAP13_1KG495020 [Panicum virgatum]